MGLLFLMAVAAVLEGTDAEFSMTAQAELVGRVVVQFNETRRAVVAVAAGEIPAVLDMVESDVAIVGFEGIGRFSNSA